MKSINLGNKTVEYEIIRTDRKTMGINIEDAKTVTVRSPKKLSVEKIEDVLKEKKVWILTKLAKMEEIKPAPKEKEFMTGEKLSYLGRRYMLEISNREGVDEVQVKLYQGTFVVEYPADLDNDETKRREAIREEFISWYREHAEAKIKERVDKYKEDLDVEPNNIVIKKQNKRWGSCSSKGNLNFNWKIIMAPMSVVDYLVVHELVHLLEDNHSREYWKTVESIIPDYREKREWLRVNGRRLTV